MNIEIQVSELLLMVAEGALSHDDVRILSALVNGHTAELLRMDWAEVQVRLDKMHDVFLRYTARGAASC